MENPRRSFRETNLVLQLIYKSQIKSKTVISWSSWKKKEGFFWSVYFVWRNCFNICVLSQFIVYWIHFQSIHTFTYQKTLLLTLFCFFWKSSKAFSVSFKRPIFDVKVSVVGFLSEIRWIAKWNSKLIIYFLLPPVFRVGRNKWDQKIEKFQVWFFSINAFFYHQAKAVGWFLGFN